MLIFAIIFIVLALIFYSIGVWSEKAQGILKKWHVGVFWVGFACDTAGTMLMSQMAGAAPDVFHAITGVIAILLMAFHAVWATIVVLRKKEKMLRSFHKFSIFVWIIWLVPFISGMIMGMRG